VLDAHWTERIIHLVCSIAVGILEGRVGACTTCMTHRDCVGVILSGVVLGIDSAFGLDCFAELGVIAISLAVAALGGWFQEKYSSIRHMQLKIASKVSWMAKNMLLGALATTAGLWLTSITLAMCYVILRI
jgi:hypothetical protein